MPTATIHVRPVRVENRWVWRVTQQAEGHKPQSGDSPTKSDATKALKGLVDGYLAVGVTVTATVVDQTENGYQGVYFPNGRMTETAIHSKDVLGPRCSSLPRPPAAQKERREAMRAPKKARQSKQARAAQEAKPPKAPRAAKTTRPPKAPPAAKPAKRTTQPPKATTAPPQVAKRPRGRPPKMGPVEQKETMVSKFLGMTPSGQQRYLAGLLPMQLGLLRSQASKHATPSKARMILELIDQVAPKATAPAPAARRRTTASPKGITSPPKAPRAKPGRKPRTQRTTSATLPPAPPARSPVRSGPSSTPSRSRPPAMPPRSTSQGRDVPSRTSGSLPPLTRSRAPVATPSLTSARRSGGSDADAEARLAKAMGSALDDTLSRLLG